MVPEQGSDGCMLHEEARLLAGVFDMASTAMMAMKSATTSIAQEYTDTNSTADCCLMGMRFNTALQHIYKYPAGN